MKTSDIIISMLFIAAIFGPIIYLYLQSKKRSHKIIIALRAFADSRNLTLIQRDVWGDKALGYDPQKRVLLFISQQFGKYYKRSIDLNGVENFELISNDNLVELKIKGKNQSDSDVESLILYNSEVDVPMEAGFHISLAKKWVELLTKSVPKGKRPLRAA